MAGLAENRLAVLVAEIRERLAGRKTYLLSALLVGTILVLVWLGRMTPEAAYGTALVFAGLLSASFRSAIEQHHNEVVNLLIALSDAGTNERAEHKTASCFNMRPSGDDAISLVPAPTLTPTKTGGAS